MVLVPHSTPLKLPALGDIHPEINTYVRDIGTPILTPIFKCVGGFIVSSSLPGSLFDITTEDGINIPWHVFRHPAWYMRLVFRAVCAEYCPGQWKKASEARTCSLRWANLYASAEPHATVVAVWIYIIISYQLFLHLDMLYVSGELHPDTCARKTKN